MNWIIAVYQELCSERVMLWGGTGGGGVFKHKFQANGLLDITRRGSLFDTIDTLDRTAWLATSCFLILGCHMHNFALSYDNQMSLEVSPHPLRDTLPTLSGRWKGLWARWTFSRTRPQTVQPFRSPQAPLATEKPQLKEQRLKWLMKDVHESMSQKPMQWRL